MSAPMKTFKIRKVCMLIYTRTYVLSNKREQVPLINQRFAQSLIENEPFEELNARLGNCIIYFVLRNHSLSFIPLSRSSVSYVCDISSIILFYFPLWFICGNNVLPTLYIFSVVMMQSLILSFVYIVFEFPNYNKKKERALDQGLTDPLFPVNSLLVKPEICCQELLAASKTASMRSFSLTTKYNT